MTTLKIKTFKCYPAALALLAALSGCGVPPARQAPPPAATPVQADSVASWYRHAAASGQTVLKIDPADTLIAVTVRRGGAFARMGHDHVVASRKVSGHVAPDAGRADFRFRLDEMSVDESALRNEAGLDTQPGADAIEGTRNNMLARVLEAEHFPLVMLHAERPAAGGDTLNLSITLHGVTRTIAVPTRIDRSGGNLVATGSFTLLQTDFGITPMSVMGGALSVQDPMELRFRIVARKSPGTDGD